MAGDQSLSYYQKDDNSLAFETWKEFCTFNRKEGQPIDDYICYEKYKVRMRCFNMDLGEHIHRLNFLCAGIYSSNFDVCQTAQKVSLLIEFSNSIFIKKFFGKNKHFGIEFFFKIHWPTTRFLLFKLFICPADVKRSKYFKGLTP